MQTKTKERIYPTIQDIENTLVDMRLIDHIRRYQLIKRYCYGHVVDAACGVGYGSHLLSNNPDIEMVTGIDISEEAIDYAINEFSNNKVEFINQSIDTVDIKCDTFVSIETIEHIKDLDSYVETINRCSPSVFIVSFPDKKSTHFNEFHVHDLKRQNIIDMFSRYVAVREIEENDVVIIVLVRIDKKIPSHIFR